MPEKSVFGKVGMIAGVQERVTSREPKWKVITFFPQFSEKAENLWLNYDGVTIKRCPLSLWFIYPGL